MKKNPRFLCALLPHLFSVVTATTQSSLPDSTEGDYKIANFPFQSGETTLPALTLHYTTFGKRAKDATKYYIILPDAIGHGNSSKPSNTGLHMKFPRYTYDDMVLADYRLLTEHLGINHLRPLYGAITFSNSSPCQIDPSYRKSTTANPTFPLGLPLV